VAVRYEKKDISPKAVTWVGIGVGIITLLVIAALVPFMRLLETWRAEQDPAPTALSRFEPGRRPPEPRLQEEPFGDLIAQRAEEDAWLRSYGWVDREAGVVRIPIEEAMRLIAERGLPARVNPEGGEPAPEPEAGEGGKP
jgi:hypothetical protein